MNPFYLMSTIFCFTNRVFMNHDFRMRIDFQNLAFAHDNMSSFIVADVRDGGKDDFGDVTNEFEISLKCILEL